MNWKFANQSGEAWPTAELTRTAADLEEIKGIETRSWRYGLGLIAQMYDLVGKESKYPTS
jgi:hypothetical protein